MISKIHAEIIEFKMRLTAQNTESTIHKCCHPRVVGTSVNLRVASQNIIYYTLPFEFFSQLTLVQHTYLALIDLYIC